MSTQEESNLSIYNSITTSQRVNLFESADTINQDQNDPALDDKLEVMKKQTRFVELGPEVTIKEYKPVQEQLSLQMTLCFYMFWFDRITTENILMYLVQSYNKFPIIFRHTSDHDKKGSQKYIAVSYVENISIKSPVLSNDLHNSLQSDVKSDVQRDIKSDVKCDLQTDVKSDVKNPQHTTQQNFLTPIPLQKIIQVHMKHVKFVLFEENGILILKSPTSNTKVRHLDHLPQGEIFGTPEFYENYPDLRDKLKQKFGCFL